MLTVLTDRIGRTHMPSRMSRLFEQTEMKTHLFGIFRRRNDPTEHRFFQINNHGTPTGWYVCTNTKCAHSLAQWGDSVWETDLEEAMKTPCPTKPVPLPSGLGHPRATLRQGFRRELRKATVPEPEAQEE